MLSRWLHALVFVLVLGTPPASVAGGEIRISAASSLTEAVNDICSRYSRKRPEATLERNFAASGTLAKQIASGAPVDLFVSANQEWMDHLVDQKRVPRAGVKNLAANVLVVVGRQDREAVNLAGLTKFSRIAIGSPKSVPAGEYAERALKAAGVYKQLQDENRLVIAKDVRQALMYAERGEVDAAFVYRTDALMAHEAVVLFEVPRELYPPIVYPVGLTAGGSNNPEAQAFLNYLQTPEMAMVMEKHGFKVAAEPASP